MLSMVVRPRSARPYIADDRAIEPQTHNQTTYQQKNVSECEKIKCWYQNESYALNGISYPILIVEKFWILHRKNPIFRIRIIGISIVHAHYGHVRWWKMPQIRNYFVGRRSRWCALEISFERRRKGLVRSLSFSIKRSYISRIFQQFPTVRECGEM